ncbi:MAG: cyclopropane-fatty-acyl-phospholipid synthase [Gemmatimonadota bacterium]
MTRVASASATSATLDLLEPLLGDIEPANFTVRLWDGTVWRPVDAPPADFTLVFSRRAALRRLLQAESEAALAEAYLGGDIRVEGDIYAVPDFARALLSRRPSLVDRARLAVRARQLPGDDRATGPDGRDLHAPRLRGHRHSVERDRVAVTHHYDLSNHFYSLFLDPRMVYSCAVFRTPDDSLEEAQVRKLDLICRKLRLREGARLLDIGCGWGSLILHAARSYGVRALGITLSERQAEVARARILEAGLEDGCRVEVRDYRTLEAEQPFDHVASVGMFEHVGRERAREYFDILHRLLRPGGSYLHHAITGDTRGVGGRRTLSDRYVFPDHDLIPVAETLAHAEAAGFEIRDVESLREHYALTLRRWVTALETRRSEAVAEVLVRPARDGSAELPLGRWDWYRSQP